MVKVTEWLPRIAVELRILPTKWRIELKIKKYNYKEEKARRPQEKKYAATKSIIGFFKQ